MNKNVIYLGFLTISLFACNNESSEMKKGVEEVVKQEGMDTIDMKLSVKRQLHLDSGIDIQWLEEGTGAKVEDGKVYHIDYRVRLQDSTIIDGVHLLRKPYVPYLVGFNMQPVGWDLTMRELKVGDFVHAQIPSRLLRGDAEAKGLIPKHADNYVNLRILSEVAPTREVDDVKIWVMEQASAKTPTFGEENEIEFFTMISTKSNPIYFNSFATGKPFRARLTDNGVIPGLKKALINAKKGDRLLILVPSKEAYGAKGLHNLVKPNEDLFYNLYVNDVIDK